MFQLLTALSTIVDASEWYLKNKLRILPKDAKVYKQYEAQLRKLNRKYKKMPAKDVEEEIQQMFAFNKEVYTLNNQTFAGKRYKSDLLDEDLNYVDQDRSSYYSRKNSKYNKRLGKVVRLRNLTQPGPFKKLRSIRDNVLDIEKHLKSVFGGYANEIFKMLTGFTFTEFLGFVNILQYFKSTLLHLDPKKITGDLIRSLGQGVNQMFAELGEITGSDTLELSPETEITNLSSSWLTHGWYMRVVSGTNIVSNGTLILWDKNGKTYTIPSCPESVWDRMKQAQGRNGHWYAPSGAGSWLQYYMKIGVVSIW